jgi:hypothetical protein
VMTPLQRREASDTKDPPMALTLHLPLRPNATESARLELREQRRAERELRRALRRALHAFTTGRGADRL